MTQEPTARLAKVSVLSTQIVALIAAAALAKAGVLYLGPYTLPGLLLVVAALAGYMAPSRAMNLLLCAWATVFGILVMEFAAGVIRSAGERTMHDAMAAYAAAHGQKYDFRTQREFLLARRAEHVPVYPSFDPGSLFAAMGGFNLPSLPGEDGAGLFPLGDISNTLTVRSNESGAFFVYRSDEHGFNNPAGSWSLPRYRVAFIGDSFVQGVAVPPERNLTAPLRARIPEVLALGRGGNGPILELASLFEYLPQRRPELVIWVYTEWNDVYFDLEREMKSPLLVRYLEQPPKLQNLEARQPEIDRQLRDLANIKLLQSSAAEGPPPLELLSLDKLRLMASGARQKWGNDFGTFERILETARDTVSSWNGRMALVYMVIPPRSGSPNLVPSRSFNRGDLTNRGKLAEGRRKVLDMCKRLGVPVIDIQQRFAQEPGRLTECCYPYPGVHFTAEGYTVVGEMIVEDLVKLRLMPGAH